MNVGVIGLGVMGQPMAQRLHAAGHALHLYDIAPQAVAALADLGPTVHRSPAEVARGADAIVISVPGPPEVAAVMDAVEGVFAGVRAGALVLETSTIGPRQGRDLAARAATMGVDFVDAPVSGGVAAARSGELTVMCGGTAAAMARARPLLGVLGTRIHHLGESGSGYLAKIVNQMIYLSYTAIFCEATALAARAGLEDIPGLLEILRTSVAGRPLMTQWERRIESGDFAPGFRITRVLKDLALGEDCARETGYAAPIFASVLRAYRHQVGQGSGERDLAVLFAASAAGRREGE